MGRSTSSTRARSPRPKSAASVGERASNGVRPSSKRHRAGKKKASPVEAFLALSDAEKEAAVAEFDQEFIGDTFKPLTPKMRQQWRKVQKGLRKSQPRKTDERVMVTFDRHLLRRADAYARERGQSLSQFIGETVQARLKAG